MQWLPLLQSMSSRARGLQQAQHVGSSRCSMWAPVGAACGLSSCGSLALEHRLNSCGHGLSCFAACGASPTQGLNPKFLSLLRWKADSLPLSHQMLTGGLPGVRPSISFSLRGGICEVPPALVRPPFSPSSLEELSSTPDSGR